MKSDVPVADICMVTSRHRCDDSRIMGLEARWNVRQGRRVAWVGPATGDQTVGAGVGFTLFAPGKGLVTTAFALLGCLRRTPSRIYHCHEPDAALVTLLVARTRGSKVVFDAHEFFRAYIADRAPRGLRTLARFTYTMLERVLYRSCDHLITVSDAIADEMAKFVTRDKITVVANCSGPQVLPTKAPALSLRRPVILHLGTASSYHQLEEMLLAFEIVHREYPEAQFLQLGKVPASDLRWLEGFLDRSGLREAVVLVPRVSFEDLGAYVPYTDVALIARQADTNANTSFATKVFDYMTFGVPIVATDLMMLRRLNSQFRVATLVDTCSPDAIAEAVLDLLRHPDLAADYSKNARAAVDLEYSWERMAARLDGVYQNLGNTTAGSAGRSDDRGV